MGQYNLKTIIDKNTGNMKSRYCFLTEFGKKKIRKQQLIKCRIVQLPNNNSPFAKENMFDTSLIRTTIRKGRIRIKQLLVRQQRGKYMMKMLNNQVAR